MLTVVKNNLKFILLSIKYNLYEVITYNFSQNLIYIKKNHVFWINHNLKLYKL